MSGQLRGPRQADLSGSACYFVVDDQADGYWDGSSVAPFDAAAWAAYAVAAAEAPPGSGRFVADWPPGLAPGWYHATLYRRYGATPDPSDAEVAAGTAFRPYAAGGTPAPPTGDGFVEALAAALEADAAVVATFPGGLANGEADRDAAFPHLVMIKAGTKRKNTFKPGCCVDRVTVHFYAVALGAGAAEAAARALKARLLPSAAYTPPDLTFDDGAEASALSRLIPADGGGESTSVDPTRGPGNTDVWQALVPVVFTVGRG